MVWLGLLELKFDTTISVGNLLAGASAVVSLIIAWTRTGARIDGVEKWIESHQKMTDLNVNVLVEIQKAMSAVNQSFIDLSKRIDETVRRVERSENSILDIRTKYRR